jgi:hypothetical protein
MGTRNITKGDTTTGTPRFHYTVGVAKARAKVAASVTSSRGIDGDEIDGRIDRRELNVKENE